MTATCWVKPPQAEKQAVEERLQRDASFADQVAETKLAMAVIKASHRSRLWQQMKAQEQQMPQGQQRFLTRPTLYWAAAASILLLVALGGYWWNQQNKYHQLYLAYYKPYGELSFPKARGGTEADMAVPLAAEQYRKKKYTECIGTLEPLTEKDDRAYFVLGLAYLGTRQFETALARFDEVSEEFDQADEYHWYKGLVFIRLNRIEEAREELTQVDEKRFPVRTILASI